MLSARLAWSRLAVHVMQLLNWAFQEVKAEMLPLYVGLAWDLLPLLSGSCSSHTLQGACCWLYSQTLYVVHLPVPSTSTVLARGSAVCWVSNALMVAEDTSLGQILVKMLPAPVQASARWCWSARSSWMPTWSLPR